MSTAELVMYIIALAFLLLPVLSWMALSARRARSAAARPQAPPPQPAPKPPGENYVKRIKESGTSAPPERGGERSSPAAEPKISAVAELQPRGTPGERFAVLDRLSPLKRAWVALELLRPPVALRHDQDPWS